MFYSSAIANLRRQRGILFSGVHVREWVCASRKPCEHHISKTDEGNFTQFCSQMCLGSYMCWLDFGVKGQRLWSPRCHAMTRNRVNTVTS